MSIQYSDAVLNAQLATILTTVGASAKLQLRTGAPPANCAAADSGSLLAELTLPATWLGTPANHVVAKSGTWSGTGSGAGSVGHYRIKDSAGTTTHIQGTVTATGGGGDMTMDNVVVANNQAITVNTYQITRGNS